MLTGWGAIPLTSHRRGIRFLPALHKEGIQESSEEPGPQEAAVAPAQAARELQPAQKPASVTTQPTSTRPPTQGSRTPFATPYVRDTVHQELDLMSDWSATIQPLLPTANPAGGSGEATVLRGRSGGQTCGHSKLSTDRRLTWNHSLVSLKPSNIITKDCFRKASQKTTFL